ncbi:hypothetical protein, partial [Peijinzhouia sedimentorum]
MLNIHYLYRKPNIRETKKSRQKEASTRKASAHLRSAGQPAFLSSHPQTAIPTLNYKNGKSQTGYKLKKREKPAILIVSIIQIL